MSRYEWQERIAAGGMGEVWKARDSVLGREVAVKVLKPELADDARFRQRFATEARNAASLHHPNIASVFDFGEASGEPPRPYLVMELVKGRPLSDLLQPDRPVPADRARQLVGQVAEALAAAHAAGIVHRDIKPANVLVTPEGKVKVTDFGIARAADDAALTGTGEVLGTPHYLSPEQAEGRPATPASDVYSLGVVLYEMLAGRRPFQADSAVGTALAHIQQPVPDLPDTVPADLARVVRRALAKDPAQRFPDAASFGRALADPAGMAPPADVVRPAPTEATQVMSPVPAAVPAQEPTQVAAPLSPLAQEALARKQEEREDDVPLHRNYWPWVAAFVVLLLVLAVVWLALNNAGGEPTDDSSQSPSAGATTRQITADAYVGLPLDSARDKLRAQGFDQIDVTTQRNGGDEEPGTVAAISPTGNVAEGARIRLTVWGDRPKEEPTPDEPTQEPTQEPSSQPSSDPGDTGGNGNGGNGGSGDGGSGDGGGNGGGSQDGGNGGGGQ